MSDVCVSCHRPFHSSCNQNGGTAEVRYMKDGAGPYHFECSEYGSELERLRAEVERLSRPAPAPEGWRMVPEKPNDKMMWCGAEKYNADNRLITNCITLGDAEEIYRAMLAAAPSPPQPEGWRTIDSAPKDGTRILLAMYGWSVDTRGLEPKSPEWKARIFDDNAPRFYNLFWCVSGQWSKRFENWNDGVEPSGLRDPTHWQPIYAPSPPQQKEKFQADSRAS